MTTPPPCVWTDAYALGFSQMDDTHREFVECVDTLLNAPDTDFAKALDAFAEHAEKHFDQEAVWMKTTDFPATDCHIDEHNAVLKSVHELQAMLANNVENSIRIGHGLAEELVRWFPGHADYMDSALAQWMVKKQFGGAPVVIRRNLQHA